MFSTGWLKAQEKAPGTGYNGLYQMTRMTTVGRALKHDERIVVLSTAVDHRKAFMSADILKSEERAKEKARQELEKRLFKGTPLDRLVNQARRGVGRPISRR